MNRKKTIIFILLGIVITAIPFVLYYGERKRISQYVEDFEKEPDGREETRNPEKEETLLSEQVIGIIEIPCLNLKYPIFEGAGAEQLNDGIGHMEGSAPLCGKGNCVLAGHNGSSRGVYFTNLNSLKVGEIVRITNKEKEVHEYTVEEMKVVDPYDSWVTQGSEEEVLTIFTCASHGTKRFVCRCVPTDYKGRKGGGAPGIEEE